LAPFCHHSLTARPSTAAHFVPSAHAVDASCHSIGRASCPHFGMTDRKAGICRRRGWRPAGSPTAAWRATDRGFDLAAYRRVRFANGLSCPRCAARTVQRWGRSGDRQRYRCTGCGRTFSDLTGTPLAHLKRLDCWPRFCDCLLQSLSVRRAAHIIGVHPGTAFRWRHRLLRAMGPAERVWLEGDVALAETCFPFSEKGRRDLDRPPRPRGDPFWWLAARTWVILARDASGRPWSDVSGSARPWVEDLQLSLGGRTAPNIRVCAAPGPFSAPARFARLRGYDYLRLTGYRLIHHPAATYGAALRRWLNRFQGVATRYLPHYLLWHRFLDMCDRAELSPVTARSRLTQCTFP
jgi:transposase-like protein